MKKIFRVLAFVTLFIPFIVNAAIKVDFEDAKYGANNYINDFSNYKWYLDFKNGNKYVYDGNNFSSYEGFVYGGLINKSEYDISIDRYRSYLKNARSYWTLSGSNNKMYALDNGKFTLLDRESKSAGVRPTHYILNQTEVSGQGSYTDPWIFIKPHFYVDIEYIDSEIIRRQGDEELKLEGVAQYGDEIVYKLKLKNTGSSDSKVNVREVAMTDSINKQISLLPESTKIKIGDKTLSLAEAKKALNGLLSSKGYDFILKPGETIELEFSVKIIGNAGDTVSNQIIYTMDDLEAEPSDKNTIAIEKTVQYNEVAEIGANVVISLDDSGSMRGTEMKTAQNAAINFANIMIGEDANTNNNLCVVAMNRGSECFEGTGKEPLQKATSYINKISASGLTPFNKALSASLTHLNTLKSKSPLNKNYLVFLSDGYPTDGSHTTNANKIKEIAEIYTIGFMNRITTLEKLCTQQTDTLFSGGPYYYNANNSNLSEVFESIAKKINEKSKITTRGVLAVSRNLDKSRNIIIEVRDKNDKLKNKISLSYSSALEQSYIINKGNRYEINIKKFEAADKISVTYFLEKK